MWEGELLNIRTHHVRLVLIPGFQASANSSGGLCLRLGITYTVIEAATAV